MNWARQESLPAEATAAATGFRQAVSSAAQPGRSSCRPIPFTRARFRRSSERLAGPLLLAGILSLIWMILRARGFLSGSFSEAAEVGSVIALWAVLLYWSARFGLMSAKKSRPLRGSRRPSDQYSNLSEN